MGLQTKRKPMVVIVGLIMALAVLLLGALPGLAVSDTTQDVLNRLAHLQRVHIDAAWLPDIRANQGTVQALMDSYLKLTNEQRLELTDQNRTDLRAYFEALYEVQGKDKAEVAALFETAAPPASEPPASAVPSEPPPESMAEPPVSSVAISQPPASIAVSSAASMPPASASTDASSQVTGATILPQTPGNDGWQGLFGSRTLGTGILMVLIVLAAALFVRFLVALRRSGKEGARQAHVDARAQELFGENYDPLEDPVSEDFLPPPPADFLDATPEAAPEANALFDEAEESRQPKDFSLFAPDNAPESLKRDKGFAAAQLNADDDRHTFVETRSEAETRSEESHSPGMARQQSTSQDSVFSPPGGVSRFDKAFGAITASYNTVKPDMPPPDALPKEAQHLFASNPDKRNSITTRSFSAEPRNGRPGKMPFRQGDPEDLDAIDE